MSPQSSQRIQRFLRDTRLLSVAEKLRYFATVVRLHRSNREFVAANPGFRLPPRALAYDAYSAPDWTFYKNSGLGTAEFFARLVATYLPGDEPLRILEWGCGPARVIRHLAAAIGRTADVYGSDYNLATIAWCQQNISGISFVSNSLEPPLPFDAACFDFIYAISVFTHLSEATSQRWIGELRRLTRPNGIVVLTTNGDSRQSIMLPDELQSYRTKGIVVRDGVEEGKRCFVATHSPDYARKLLFGDFEVLRHVPAGFPYNSQDYWVLRRPSPPQHL
jgi:SAM-dependent methyltransferase